MSLVERRNCVAEPADYVCEWNWCWQISDIYSGTCLFTVLNINVFNWFVGLSAWLIQYRSRRILGDLTSQPVPVIIIICALCFVVSQVFD